MINTFKSKVITAAAVTAMFMSPDALVAQFNYGNIVVLQVGDGSNTLSNTGNAIVLREFSSLGTPAFSATVPTTGTEPMIIGGTATSEGALNLSPDLKHLVFGGYAAGLPNAAALNTSNGTLINRAIGIMDAAGSYTRVATSTVFHSAGNIRSAASDGQSNYWSAGSNQGTNYFGVASSPVQGVQNTITNTRHITVNSGSLYFSTGSGTQGIYRVGTGLPVTAGQTNSLIINTSTVGTSASPYGFYFDAAMTVCYVADDRTVVNGGGIQKWVNSAGTWTLAYTLNTGTTSVRGVIADFSGTNPLVFATTTESTGNRLISILDIGSSSTPTTLATSVTNTIFRGIAFAPCAAPQIVSATSAGSVCSNAQLSLNVTTTGSAPGYTWTGAGNFNNANVANPLVTNPQTGNYTITVSNACGTASSVVAANVELAPSISVIASQDTLCAGDQLVLTASGASSYTWSNGITNGSGFAASSSAVYTVSGSAANGCVSTQTVDITVNPLPVLTVNSLSVCVGDQGTLTASGANTYTWNTGSNNPAIVVSPTIVTSYTVEGTSLAGCQNQSTITVGITNPPVITVNSATVCAGTSATLSANGADTYTWSTGSGNSAIVVTPGTNTTYTVSGNANGCSVSNTQTTSVVVNQLPVLNVSSSSTLLCEGSTATLTANGAASYSWNTGNSGPVVVISPTTTTSYTVQGTDANNCSDEIAFTQNVVNCTGISETGAFSDFNMYPNPAKEYFILNINSNIINASLYNVGGQLIKELDLSAGQHSVVNLPSGIYFLICSDSNGTKTVKKLIKE